MSLDKIPICIANIQYSLTNEPKRLERPQGFNIHMRDISISIGVRFCDNLWPYRENAKATQNAFGKPY